MPKDPNLTPQPNPEVVTDGTTDLLLQQIDRLVGHRQAIPTAGRRTEFPEVFQGARVCIIVHQWPAGMQGGGAP